jgi:hypothetical protein
VVVVVVEAGGVAFEHVVPNVHLTDFCKHRTSIAHAQNIWPYADQIIVPSLVVLSLHKLQCGYFFVYLLHDKDTGENS